MNFNRVILKPYTGICKHLPAYRTICRYIAPVCTGVVLTPSRRDGRCPARAPLPRTFPKVFAVAAAHADEVVIVAPRTPRPPAPSGFLDDELDGLQPPAAGFVVEVAHAYEARAVASDEPLRPRHAGTQGQPGFHESPFAAQRAARRAVHHGNSCKLARERLSRTTQRK